MLNQTEAKPFVISGACKDLDVSLCVSFIPSLPEANKNPEGTAHALCHTDAAFDLANGTDQFIRDVLCVLIAGTKPRSQFKDKG